ncbi:hypothetical protein MACK_003205 [Theileria orientalis]|uniref:tRNA-intron lyase n=1 Tax=Theileria orientalis TaxID=68886 RepID=A0A976SI98_THEOR|nr:hypothetical protein MACK_003205 [Theileria orientalis]
MSVESVDFQQLIELEGDPVESIVKYFNKAGYIAADGSKFGGDLVIYSAAGPELTHSKYLLFLIEPKVTWRDIISYYRVASQTAKIPLLAQIYKENKIRLIQLNKLST